MKRVWTLLTVVAVFLTMLSGCTAPVDNAPAVVVPTAGNTEAFRLSSVSDISDANASRVYRVAAPYTDTYTITSADTKSITIYGENAILGQGEGNVTVDLAEGGVYTLAVETAEANKAFALHTEAKNHLITLPYDVADPVDTTTISLNSDGTDPLTPAEVNYQKREGGTYIYSNNPELIPPASVGEAFIRTEDLTGEVYFTFEHANYAGTPFYLGYQIKNDSDHDVYVTVTNVGYQAGGTWFGQLAWYDFYNTKFELPDDYLNAAGQITSKYSSYDYAYQDYTPRVFQPTTYRLPAGEYFYVIGGTTEDAYNHINVDNTADKLLNPVKCANGNVKFHVTGGAVTATFYAYDDIKQVQANPEAQGYLIGNYAAQYVGTADHAGVIDNFVTWTFSDETKDGLLPVTYTNRYDENCPSKTAAYAAYDSTDHKVNRTTKWMTHLNPQNNHQAVGMDIVEFTYVDQYGNDVVIDNDHADGSGEPANTANWMIEYQDHFTLVNQGDKDRTVTLRLKDNGTLAMLVRDSVTGEVLEASYTTGLAEKGSYNYSYRVTVPAHSVKQITLDYVLVACSYGSVVHFASLATPK